MYPQFQLTVTLPDAQEYMFLADRREAESMIENFSDCLNADGRFKISGTKYFWCVPGHSDKLYRMTAYGGYEPGGRGCFYQEIKED
jgi:hypothetical protein